MPVLFTILVLSLSASEVSVASCFNPEQKISAPLQEAIYKDPKNPSGGKANPKFKDRELDAKDKSDWGKKPGDVIWGKVQGTVRGSIEDVYKILLDHKNTQSSKVTGDPKPKKIENPNHLELHRINFVTKPFIFVTVEWDEEWAYTLLKGSKDKPEEILVSYQKLPGGTEYIKHLCGNMLLRKISDTETNVYLYEEKNATQQSDLDCVKGHTGTLQTIRKNLAKE